MPEYRNFLGGIISALPGDRPVITIIHPLED